MLLPSNWYPAEKYVSLVGKSAKLLFFCAEYVEGMGTRAGEAERSHDGSKCKPADTNEVDMVAA